MNKNSFKLLITKTNIAIFLAITMLVGFLVSRAVLSIAMILFGINALWNIHPKKWLKQKWWVWGVVWIFLFGFSFFWSDDKAYWNEHLQVKLPILLLPLSFASLPSFSRKQQEIYTVALCLTLLSGVSYSMYFLLTNSTYYIEGYSFSNVLPTLPADEHIRFTIALAMGIIWCSYMFRFIRNNSLRLFVGFCILIFTIAIHIYAVRTGLLAFYVFISGYLCYLFFQKHTRKLAAFSIIILAVASFLSFKYIPTLAKRVNHFKWTIMVFNKGEMNPDYGDIGRYISYDLAIKIIKENPLLGIGAGDIFSEMDKKYDDYYPQVKKEQRLVPHNQFLLIAVAAGIPTMIAFAIWLFYPLLEMTRNKNGFFYFITWLVLLIPIMVEPVLEIQFGIFVFIFFLLWQRQASLKPIKEHE